jgi:hypothetical protein
MVLCDRPILVDGCSIVSDRRRFYFASIFTWSLFTLLQGAVGLAAATFAFYTLFALRFLVGLAEAPSFPANARVVAAWFPANERGTASAVFNSAQYFATVLFAPIMGWITTALGWPYVFYFMGLVGIIVSLIWLKVVYAPNQHPYIGQPELDYIERGGALVNMDPPKGAARVDTQKKAFEWGHIQQLKSATAMIGIYLAQLHQRADVFLHHLVPGLSRSTARGAVDPERRDRRLDPRNLRLRWRRAGRHLVGLHAAQGVLAYHIPQDPRSSSHAALDEYRLSATMLADAQAGRRRQRPWPSSARAAQRSAGGDLGHVRSRSRA